MLKRLALIVVLGISNLQAADAPKTGFIQKIKNSSAMVKLFGGIVPCIMTFIAMDAVMKNYKDNPELSTFVDIAYYIKWTSLILATIFYDWLFKFNFIKWLTGRSLNDLSISKSDINTDDSIALQA